VTRAPPPAPGAGARIIDIDVTVTALPGVLGVRPIARGLAAAVRARPLTIAAIAVAVLTVNLALPPLVLSAFRKPWTYFTFNPWLEQLPEYLASPAPFDQKLDFVARVALFWFTADGPMGAPEWGFAVDTLDLLRFLALAVLVAVHFALWLHAREQGRASGWRTRALRPTGLVGAFAGALGLSTGPCSVVGCGAPVLPVVALVFAGLSSGTLALLSALSRVVITVVIAGLAVAIVVLARRIGLGLQPAAARADAG
jgi:hypothetical protein